MAKHKLVVLNPGHFHAALTLRERHPRLDDRVYVYAEDGPEVETFLHIVRTFNTRDERPTRWDIRVYKGADYFERLLAERPGDVVVISGENDKKMAFIHRLHTEGFFVLGDKTWLIREDDEPLLAQATAGPPLAMDIMTERQDETSQLQKLMAARTDIFGTWLLDSDGPAISLHSVHHLYKIVNNAPLVRPAWYFDVAVQGEGMTDVTTHLVDFTQWITGDELPFDYNRDVELVTARQWPTDVPLEKFSRITGHENFPRALQADVEDGVLSYLCNARLEYRLRGVPVEIESLWAVDLPEGGGDTHRSVLRGTKARISVTLGPETDFVSTLTVRPTTPDPSFAARLERALEDLAEDYPGLGLAANANANAYRVVIPDALRTTHEEHFAAALDEFLAYLDTGTWPDNLGPDIVTKYTLLARARTLSHQSG